MQLIFLVPREALARLVYRGRWTLEVRPRDRRGKDLEEEDDDRDAADQDAGSQRSWERNKREKQKKGEETQSQNFGQRTVEQESER